MHKRRLLALCLAVAAPFLCGCGRIDGDVGPIDPPPVRTSVPAPTPEPTPEPVPTAIPEALAFTVTSIKENKPCILREAADTTTITITTEQGEDDDWPTTRLLIEESNGWSSAVDYDGYFVSAYYCETKIGPFILLTTDIGISNSVTTYILDAGTLAETGSVGGSIESLKDGMIGISCEVDMLGTYAATHAYIIGDSFALHPAGDGLYRITDSDFLVTTRDLPAQIGKNGQYWDETLPSGTELRVTATDGKSVVYVETRDKRAGRFAVEIRAIWEIWIYGAPAEEWFVELPYAG